MTDRISKRKKEEWWEDEEEKEYNYCIKYRWDSEKGCVVSEKKIISKCKKIPLSVLKKKKEEERQELKLKVDKLFQLLPSINGAKATDGAESEIPKTFDQLTAEAVAMKEHLETHMNGKGSEFLLNSVEYVIHMVARFCRETKLPPFDWDTRRYPKWCFKRSPERVEDNMCEFAKNGFKPSECGLALPGFGSHGIAQVNSVTGNETDKAYASIPSSSDPNRKLPQSDDVSLDEKEKKIWLEFDKGNPEVMSYYKVIQLDHPIVSVIGDFAVAAFNEACEMHFKKDEHNNLHDIEFMECKYLKLRKTYDFYMIIEAVEEGNLGVYETQVLCSSDGNMRILTKFLLTDRKPVGTKATAISHFSCLRSVCKTLEGVVQEKLAELDKVLLIVKGGMARGIPMHKLRCIVELRTEIIKGLHQLLFMGHSLLFSPDCSRTTNPDVWSHPDNNVYEPMVRRTAGTLCRGYDYRYPLGWGR